MQHPTRSCSVSLVCLAAPDDTPFLVQWERHLLPLQQAGLVRFWSEQHLQAGADRMEQLVAHLNQADCLVLLISSDFFADDDCLTWMQHTLLQKPNTVLIPLLLRPVEWQDSALASLPCLPTNGTPITQWPTSDEAWHACVRGLRSLLNLPAQRAASTRSSSRSNTNRSRMLRRLSHSYRELLDQSLQGMAWMELGLTKKPDAVQNVTNLALRIGQQPERELLSGVSIVQVYEDAEQELLILGEPGAGKSTLLLHLAQHLVALAEANEHALLPVILPLSSLAVKRGTLEDWMVEQIAQAYDVPRKVSQQWVQDEQILPLLDGLDEMDEAARPACIGAINAYHRAHLTPLVVCSRTTEYESAADKQRLALQSAVIIRPLTSEQIEAILNRAGESIAGLQVALHRQPLQGLATTPLMLSVLMLTYQGKTVRTSTLNETALELQIWTDYIQRMVERQKSGNVRRYSLEQIQPWLEWLARQMREHNQTVFYLEHLQSSWLTTRRTGGTTRIRTAYKWLAVRLPRLLIGIVIGFFVSMLFYNVSSIDKYSINNILQSGLIGGLLGGLFDVPTLSSLLSLLSRRSANVLQRWRTLIHMRRALLVAAAMGTVLGLSEGLAEGLSSALRYGLISLLISLTFEGGQDIQLSERLRWSWKSVRRGLLIHQNVSVASWLGSIVTVGIGLSSALRFNLKDGIFFGLADGLSIMLTCWILLGLWDGKSHEKVEDQDRLKPNQGISHSFRNSLLLGLIGAGVLWLAVIVGDGLSDGLSDGHLSDFIEGLGDGLNNGWLIGCCGGFLTCALSGGLSTLRHYVIRLLLAVSHIFPWRAQAFLDNATAHILLRRVGGGYSFVHRRLLDYFADAHPSTVEEGDKSLLVRD